MGFESPLLLLALSLASVPIAIHLLRHHKLSVVRLPTVALLSRAVAKSRKRLRLVDILLLICRILLLALLAFALAKPFYSVRLAYGDGQRASLAIVLDDSMSMSRGTGSTLQKRAIERATRVIESLPEGSEVAIIMAGEPPRRLVARTTDRAHAVRRLAELPERTARGTHVPSALRIALRELAGAVHANRRVLVLSDVAQHGRFDEIDWKDLDIPVGVERIADERATVNHAITDAVAVPDPTTQGKASVRFEIRSSETKRRDLSVRIVKDDRELARTRVALVRGVGRGTLHAPIATTASPAATLAIEGGDDLPIDDRRGVLLRPPTTLRILIVAGDTSGSRHDEDVRFLVGALAAAPADRGTITYGIADPDSITAAALSAVDVVMWVNAAAPSASVARSLIDFVLEGGGLLVTPGERFAPRTFAARLGPVLPAVPRATAPAPEPVGLVVDKAEELSAVTGLALVRVQKRLLVDRGASSASVPLRFTDASPALLLEQHGQGRVALWLTTVNDAWTDLPYRPGFVPLVLSLVQHLAKPGAMSDRPHAPLGQVRITPPANATTLRIVAPDATVTEIPVAEPREPVVFRETGTPGAYRVLVSKRGGAFEESVRTAFLVAPPPSESDLSAATLPHARQRQAHSGSVGTAVRRPVAPWLYLLAAIVALAEALLRHQDALATWIARARTWSRKRLNVGA